MIQSTIERWLRWEIERCFYADIITRVEYWAEADGSIRCSVLEMRSAA